MLTMTTAARNAPIMLGLTAIAMPDQPLVYAAMILSGRWCAMCHFTVLCAALFAERAKKAMPIRSTNKQFQDTSAR
ncbi:hypothetical protein NKH89_12705 [Mesorhizobium sp. M0923]|uniref:hypothetical protein n=1 Tax=unclassified Mesorhizobium TaxID=325217 RepID=UPI0003D06446|nr:hypothetical protein [Mesorhizobium sp. L48C026A00]ESZ08519.1 hypothetical protein X737_33740 [Mesorhizobium sp. L48C026A00]